MHPCTLAPLHPPKGEQLSNIYLPNQAKVNWLNASLGTLATLEGAKLHLFASGITITADTTLEILSANETYYPGYAPQLLENWSTPVIIGGRSISEPDSVSFQKEVDTTAIAGGAFITNGAGDTLLGVAVFDTPVSVPFESELVVTLQWQNEAISNL